MANPVLLSDCKIYLGAYDLTGSARRVQMTGAKAELTDSRFGDGHEAYFPGLQQVSSECGGFFSSSALANGEPDPVIFDKWNTYAAGVPLLVAPPYAPTAAAGADGNTAYMVVGGQFQYEGMSGNHGETLAYRFTTKPGTLYRLYRQTIAYPKTALNGNANGTAYQLGVLAAGQTLVAALHVFAAATANYTVKIQSDDNSGFTTPTDRITFAAVTGLTHEVKKLDGAVATDDYWRVNITKTAGQITAAVSFSIVPTAA